jgi:hypothetical protein
VVKKAVTKAPKNSKMIALEIQKAIANCFFGGERSLQYYFISKIIYLC